MKKQDCIEFLLSKNVAVDKKTTSILLHEQVRKWISQNVKPECVRLAEAAGHKVLLTPPYHSDFQPIELIWAYIKGNIGHQYDKDSNYQVLLKQLQEEFTNLDQNGSALIQHMINLIMQNCKEFYDKVIEEDVHTNNVYEDDNSEISSDSFISMDAIDAY